MDEHEPEPKEPVHNPFTNKVIKEKMNWKILYQEREVGEGRRKEIVNEIERLLDIE